MDPDFGALIEEAVHEVTACGGQEDCPCGAEWSGLQQPAVETKELRPMRKQRCKRMGTHWDGTLESHAYLVDGVRCYRVVGTALRQPSAVLRRADDVQGSWVLVQQPAILRAIERRCAHDRAVQDARDAFAMACAGGDTLLAEALRMHLWYTHGALHDPVVRDGIAFYAVGRNASHDFCVGVRDGQQYVLASCDDGDDADEEHIRAVPTWDGCYLGHA